MGLNAEIRFSIQYTDETGTYNFFEGDKVICYVREQVYNGTIVHIGLYRETPDSEAQQFICIDTSKSNTSLSSEIIKVKDITKLHKNPFYDENKIFAYDSEFVDMFIKNGCSKERAETMYNSLNDAIVFYNIPVVNAISYAMQTMGEITNEDINNNTKRILELAKKCSSEAENKYFELIQIYTKMIGRNERNISDLVDTLKIVSKCYNDLSEQKRS